MIKQLFQYMYNVALRFGENIITRPFVQHVSVLTLANGVSAILSFVQGVLVARWLGPELYGVVALVMSVPTLLYTFFDARSAEALVKYLSEFHARGERERAVALCYLGYLIDFTLATLACIGVIVLAPWASRAVVHRPETSWLLIIYAAAFIPRSLQGTSYAVLAVHGRFYTVALINIVTTLVRVSLVLGLVLAGWGVIGVVVSNAIAMCLTGLVYAFTALPLIHTSWGVVPWSATWSNLKGHRVEIFRFLIYNNLNTLLGMIPKQLDVVLLGYFRNPTEVGFYKIAKTFATTIAHLVGPLQSVTYPELAKLWSLRDTQSFWHRVRKIALQVGLPLGLVTITGVGIFPFLVSFALGKAFLEAVPAIQLLWLGSVTWLAFFWLRPTYFAQGRLKEWTIITIIVVFLSIAGFFVFIPRWGYLGLSAWLAWLHVFGHLIGLSWLIRIKKRGGKNRGSLML